MMGNCLPRIGGSKEAKRLELQKTVYFKPVDMDTLITELHTSINPESLATKREFHKDGTTDYWLPKDKDEHDRLTGQHFAFKDLLNGNITSSVKDILDFQKGISILDIGCGSGVWMADMSSEYPNCTYYGCDIIDTPDIIRMLPNLSYSYGNVTQRLPYEDNTFDFVHMRFFVYSLRADEWPKAIKEAIRVAKPGGMIQFVDFTPEYLGKEKTVCNLVTQAAINFCIGRTQIYNIAYELESLVSANSNGKILQSYSIPFCTNDGTDLAKKFIWDFARGVEGIMKHLGPELGVQSKEEISVYLTKYKQDMFKSGFKFVTSLVSLQKANIDAMELPSSV
ncbi:S-adenosyl-L-methionine-dependent methyltransferase [Sporodiniella umbellata]|nr:S-adenosyl-L-methionine-dependent methyltransferase [Sporodiniella umbellata]